MVIPKASASIQSYLAIETLTFGRRKNRSLRVFLSLGLHHTHSTPMTLNIPQSPTSPDVGEKQPLLSQHPHTSASKVEIRHNSPDINLTDQETGRIPHVDPIAAAGVHVPGLVALDPVRYTGSAIGKQLSTRQPRAVVYDIVLVDAAG